MTKGNKKIGETPDEIKGKLDEASLMLALICDQFHPATSVASMGRLLALLFANIGVENKPKAMEMINEFIQCLWIDFEEKVELIKQEREKKEKTGKEAEGADKA